VLPFVLPSNKAPKNERIRNAENLLRKVNLRDKMSCPTPDGSFEFGICVTGENRTTGVYIVRDTEGAIMDGEIYLFTDANGRKWFQEMQGKSA